MSCQEKTLSSVILPARHRVALCPCQSSDRSTLSGADPASVQARHQISIWARVPVCTCKCTAMRRDSTRHQPTTRGAGTAHPLRPHAVTTPAKWDRFGFWLSSNAKSRWPTSPDSTAQCALTTLPTACQMHHDQQQITITSNLDSNRQFYTGPPQQYSLPQAEAIRRASKSRCPVAAAPRHAVFNNCSLQTL